MEYVQSIPEPDETAIDNAVYYYEQFLKALGIWDVMEEEPQQRTPARVVHSYLEFFGNKLEPLNFTCFDFVPSDERVGTIQLVGNISFASLCAHHHLPFFGRAHVAYIPGDTVVGLSKIARVVELFTHGALIQEDVTERIANFLFTHDVLTPRGVVVMMEAEHTCMGLRGARKPGHRIVTLTQRGEFCDPNRLNQFLMMIKGA